MIASFTQESTCGESDEALKAEWPAPGETICCCGCEEELWLRDVAAVAHVKGGHFPGMPKLISDLSELDGQPTMDGIVPMFFCRQCCDDGTMLESIP